MECKEKPIFLKIFYKTVFLTLKLLVQIIKVTKVVYCFLSPPLSPRSPENVFNLFLYPNLSATFLAASISFSAYICVVLIWACPVAALAISIPNSFAARVVAVCRSYLNSQRAKFLWIFSPFCGIIRAKPKRVWKARKWGHIKR